MSNALLSEHYLNYYLVRQCGIPNLKPIWTISRKDFSAMFISWTLSSDSVYVKSPRGNKNYALSLEEGEVVWDCDVSDNECEGVCLCGEYVCIGWYVHRVSDGKIIYDLRELVDNNIKEYQIIIPFHNGLICRVIGERSRIVYVDLRNGSVEDYPLDLELFRVTKDQGYLLGWSDSKVCCLDTKSKEMLWSYNVPSDRNGQPLSLSAFTVHGDKAYLQENIKDIVCFDVKDGAVVWKLKSKEPQAFNQSAQNPLSATSLACGNGALVLERDDSYNGYIEVLSPHNGDLFWRADMVSPSASIAGDTVIVIYGDDGEHMQMRDLFTGETLWEMPRSLTAMIKVLAWGNKIVVSNTLGTFRCYEWLEPYHSPAR